MTFCSEYTNLKSFFFICNNYSKRKWISWFLDKFSFQKILITTEKEDLHIYAGIVINYDIPAILESYLTRLKKIMGEGRSGTYVTFVTPPDLRFLRSIKNFMGNTLSKFKLKGRKFCLNCRHILARVCFFFVLLTERVELLDG